ncbi:MAG TPA: hypothetical protein VMT89_07640 [Candidatus Acidoferrales bacterium]|nr:hypothetical protein [Candidatus Acidoferrales bacterium]
MIDRRREASPVLFKALHDRIRRDAPRWREMEPYELRKLANDFDQMRLLFGARYSEVRAVTGLSSEEFEDLSQRLDEVEAE